MLRKGRGGGGEVKGPQNRKVMRREGEEPSREEGEGKVKGPQESKGRRREGVKLNNIKPYCCKN